MTAASDAHASAAAARFELQHLAGRASALPSDARRAAAADRAAYYATWRAAHTCRALARRCAADRAAREQAHPCPSPTPADESGSEIGSEIGSGDQ